MSTRAFLLIAILGGLLDTTGCQPVRYRTTLPPSAETHAHDEHFFIFGLLGRATVEVWKTCPQGVSAVTVQHSFLNVMAGILSVGLYTPSNVEIVCAAVPTAARVEGQKP
jgi:hypothetical protein